MFANKLVVVTGANRGIGFATSKFMHKHGANVVLACRNSDEGLKAVANIQGDQGSQGVSFIKPLDLSSFESVHDFSDALVKKYGKGPDILVNNAGILLKDRQLTNDGFEATFQTNYLSPALLTLLSLKFGTTRVVHVSSGVHRTVETNLNDLQMEDVSYDGWKAYCHSKRLQILFSNKLARLSAESGDELFKKNPVSICVDPGWIKTDLVRKSHGWSDVDIEKKMGKANVSPEGAVKTIVKAATDNTLINGAYLLREKPVKTGTGVEDVKVQDKLWELTKELVRW